MIGRLLIFTQQYLFADLYRAFRPLLLGSLMVVVGFSGCGTKAVPQLPSLDEFAPIPAEESKHILTEIRNSASQLTSGRLSAKVTLEHGLVRERLAQGIVFQRPDRFRSEFFVTSANRLMSKLVTSDGNLVDIRPQDGIAYVGIADRNNIGRLLSVPFEVDQLMCWLFGLLQLPPPEEFHEPEVYIHTKLPILALRYLVGEERYQVTLKKTGDGVKSPGEYRLLTLGIESAQDATLHFLSEFHYQNPASPFLTSISLELPLADLSGTLTIGTQVRNPDLSMVAAKLFAMDVPQGLETKLLDEVQDQPEATNGQPSPSVTLLRPKGREEALRNE